MTEDDANEVSQLLHESLLDAFTTETGVMDFGRKGGLSLSKQVNKKYLCYKPTVQTLNPMTIIIYFLTQNYYPIGIETNK